jgi:NAD(P)-dependent dehydrogenase (short-subunit alcohol dehydrogenase family)
LITHYHDTICTDRVAIVTGGSRSVGREVVRKLANRGHAVVVGYIRDQGAADSIVEEVLAAVGTTHTIPRRSRRPARLERMFAEMTESFWGIDILVHAAGQVIRDPVADHDLDRFDALQRTNVGARSSSTGRQRGTSVTEERSSTSPALPSARRCRSTPPPRRAERRWRR